MRNSAFAVLTICALLLGACGKIERKNYMSEEQALDVLTQVPETTGRNARGKMGLSTVGLMELINELVASGKLIMPSNVRRAATGAPDLTQLANLFALLQSGQANSIVGIANGLIGMNAGNVAGTSSGIAGILSLLQTLAPMIATVAPQFAGIIQALTVILPLVMTFISIFKKKPKAAFLPSALRFA